MSLYYFNVSHISRGKNQSAVASASYRSGESLYSELDMEMKSYGKRTVQPETFIHAPEHAPEWVYNRERLWNEVENFENRSNSRLAKEITLALPIELDNSSQRQLLEEFVNENFVERGMVADVAIHRDVEHNPHAHILLTTRAFKENGEWAGKKKREYLKDEQGNFIFDEEGKKKFKTIAYTDWDQKDTLLEWRQNFAEKINEYYIKNDIQERVSHQSYEEQGLDKIAKHRLSLTEYRIEQSEKEKALKNGVEYQPKTTYALMNYEIEKSNKELENINNKIVDLNEYRKSVKGQTIQELNNLRRNFSLSSEDWDSLKVVAKRMGGFVDLTKASDNLRRLDFWKQRLSKEKHEIVAFGKSLEKAKVAYKQNPKDVLMYGFTPRNFETLYSEREKEYKEKIDAFNKQITAFNDMYKHSNRAYTIQKTFIQEEFKFLYPNYGNILDGNDNSIQLQSSYVERFKKEGVLLNHIPEIEHNLHEYLDVYVKAESLLKDWEDNSNSLMILERTKGKYQREYAQQYENWEGDGVFNKSKQFTSVLEQIKDKEMIKSQLLNKASLHLKQIYPSIKDDTLNQLPPNSNIRLIELYVKDRSTGELSKDLLLIQKDVVSDIDKVQSMNQNEKSSVTGSGELFTAIVQNAQRNEANQNEFDKQRRKAKYKNKVRKHRKDIGELEL